jgi:hypothetical protein
MFLTQVKKHAMLALFSTVRLHRVQALMNLRQVLEAGASAAFAIANPEHVHFVDTDERGILNPTKELTKARYDWLTEHYPEASIAIKRLKDTINASAAHANFVSADSNFRPSQGGNSFDAPFFDIEDEYHVRIDLWTIGNIAYGTMDLFFRVNRGRNVITFEDHFPSRLQKLANDNRALQTELMASERYRRTQERLAESS